MYASRPLLFTSHVSSQRSPVEVVIDKTTQHSFFMPVLESYSTNKHSTRTPRFRVRAGWPPDSIVLKIRRFWAVDELTGLERKSWPPGTGSVCRGAQGQ